MEFSFVPKVEEILNQHDISCTEEFEIDHITINTDEIMVDAGFARDRKVLDLYLDHDNKILFIGLLRIPCFNRRKKIGTRIIDQIVEWAQLSGYSLFLDSCGDSYAFWCNCGFSLVERKSGFDIMGFGDNRTELKEKWKDGRKIFEETH